jgi:hypothetical protein
MGLFCKADHVFLSGPKDSRWSFQRTSGFHGPRKVIAAQRRRSTVKVNELGGARRGADGAEMTRKRTSICIIRFAGLPTFVGHTTRLLTLILGCGLAVSCSSSSATAPTTQPTSTSAILLSDASVRASLERWAGGPWDIGYAFCFALSPTPNNTAGLMMTLRRVEYTVIGPGGSIYSSPTDPSLGGQTMGLGRFGCFFTYADQNITRPVATSYRIVVEYSVDNVSPPKIQTVVATGSIESEVPPQPFITSVTLIDDIQDLQKTLRRPAPVTFTVTSVVGGTPPYQFRWSLNGFLLRDWDPNPVLLWDGATLGGHPAVSGGYTLAVNVRRSGWTPSEAVLR